jgi:membrane protein
MSDKAARFRRGGAALGRALRSILDHRNPRDAAAISYFSFFALFPGVLVLLAVASDILGKFEVEKSSILQRVIVLLPFTTKFLNENLAQITDPSTTLVLSCVVIVMWTSSWVFSIVENALNRAWDVPKRRTFWESRLRSITVVVMGGTILLASVAILAIASPASAVTKETLRIYFEDPIISWLWKSVAYSAVLLLAILVFTCVFKILPDRKVFWMEALSGAIVSALLWELGTFVFIKLVPYFDYERIYGRMGAVIALLAWVYTSNLLMLLGANFSAQLDRSASEQIPASETPVIVRDDFEAEKKKVRSFRRPGSTLP